MSNKTFHFLSGMHRSGNTVLAAILNQNPKIYVSPISPLVEYMWRCHSEDFQDAVISPRKDSKKYMVSKMIENYYENINKPIIFDRSKVWANPDNLNMIKQYITDTPKIIFTVRPLRECIASIIKVDKDLTLTKMKHFNYPINNDISINDNIAEFALSENIYNLSFFASLSMSKPENNGFIHVVRYEDLTQNPKLTMEGIYQFIKIENYKHNFKNIVKLENELDTLHDISESVHQIKKTLKASTLDPSQYLSQRVIDMCNEKDLFYS